MAILFGASWGDGMEQAEAYSGAVGYCLNKGGAGTGPAGWAGLMGKGIEYIYTSDLGRARETTQLIAEKLQLPIAGTRRGCGR